MRNLPKPLQTSKTHTFVQEDSASLLCDLSRGGDVEKIKTLCSGGVNPNACDYDKRTAMHLGGPLAISNPTNFAHLALPCVRSGSCVRG